MEFKNKIVIKRLNASDINKNFDSMLSLLKSSYDISFSNNQFENEYFEDKINSLIDFIEEEKAIVFGALNEVLLGFIWGYPRLFLGEKRIHINHFVVDKSTRGLGVGSMLIKEIENYAIENGIELIDLMVTSNSSSVKFYERNDFEIERYQMLKRL